MSPSRLLHDEVFGFLFLLAALLAYRALTGRLVLSGLLSVETGSGAVAPERVQLLLATLYVSTLYLREVAHSTGTSMPDVSNAVLVVFGGSGGAYAAVKAIRFQKLATTLERKFQ